MTRDPRVGCEDLVGVFVAGRNARPVEVGWELHIPEERCGILHGEFTVSGDPSIDEEVDGEDGLAVRGDKTNVPELELGIRSNGILNA